MAYNTQTSRITAMIDTDRIVFNGDNPSGSGQVLVQVSFKDGASGVVKLKARLTAEHAPVIQSDEISSDTMIRMAFCPQILADCTKTGAGTILISAFAA